MMIYYFFSVSGTRIICDRTAENNIIAWILNSMYLKLLPTIFQKTEKLAVVAMEMSTGFDQSIFMKLLILLIHL